MCCAEEANVSCRRLKEEVEVQKLLHDQKLEELRGIHMAQLDRLNECHSRELGEREYSLVLCTYPVLHL